MTRTVASVVAATVLLILVPLFSGCGSDSVLSSACDVGPCSGSYRGNPSGMGGTAYTVRAELNGGMVSFSEFYASCRGVYPDGRGCGYTGRGLDATAVIGGDCQFTFQVRDADDPATLEIRGSVDAGSCRISGTYDLDYGSCCRKTGSWSASKF